MQFRPVRRHTAGFHLLPHCHHVGHKLATVLPRPIAVRHQMEGDPLEMQPAGHAVHELRGFQ